MKVIWLEEHPQPQREGAEDAVCVSSLLRGAPACLDTWPHQSWNTNSLLWQMDHWNRAKQTYSFHLEKKLFFDSKVHFWDLKSQPYKWHVLKHYSQWVPGSWEVCPKTHKPYKTLSGLHGFSSSLVFQLPPVYCCIHVLCFGGRVKERKFLRSPGHNPCFYEIWTHWPAQQRLQVGRQIWAELCRGSLSDLFLP